MKDLGIVIVNWNTSALLEKCLTSLYQSEGDFTYELVVVDNASTDDSAERVAERFPQAQLICSEENVGYPRGNNLGLRALGFGEVGQTQADAPRYALLLNPDTELPPTALYEMIRFMDENPEIGIAGPKLILPDGQLDKACRRSFPTPLISFYHYSGLAKIFPNNPRFARYNMSYCDPDQSIEVDSVVGAYMQLRKEVIEQIGLLDEQFFMYGEDLDWAYRAKEKGWKVWYYASVTVYHVKRAASKQSKKAQSEFYRAMLLFYRKHFEKQTSRPVHYLVLLGILLKGGKGIWKEIRHPS